MATSCDLKAPRCTTVAPPVRLHGPRGGVFVGHRPPRDPGDPRLIYMYIYKYDEKVKRSFTSIQTFHTHTYTHIHTHTHTYTHIHTHTHTYTHIHTHTYTHIHTHTHTHIHTHTHTHIHTHTYTHTYTHIHTHIHTHTHTYTHTHTHTYTHTHIHTHTHTYTHIHTQTHTHTHKQLFMTSRTCTWHHQKLLEENQSMLTTFDVCADVLREVETLVRVS